MGSQKWFYLDVVRLRIPYVMVLSGRTGCFLAYDHPGSETSIVLAQRYSDGVVRHNLGLDEALYTLPVALLFLWLGRRGRRAPDFSWVGWRCSMRRCAFCSIFSASQMFATFRFTPRPVWSRRPLRRGRADPALGEKKNSSRPLSPFQPQTNPKREKEEEKKRSDQHGPRPTKMDDGSILAGR